MIYYFLRQEGMSLKYWQLLTSQVVGENVLDFWKQQQKEIQNIKLRNKI